MCEPPAHNACVNVSTMRPSGTTDSTIVTNGRVDQCIQLESFQQCRDEQQAAFG
jgi:hypothetical protein